MFGLQDLVFLGFLFESMFIEEGGDLYIRAFLGQLRKNSLSENCALGRGEKGERQGKKKRPLNSEKCMKETTG